ncbi:MAG: hypothetical protein BJ554DRAFT_1008, partial [Olpidium bornovanus]
MSSAGKGKGWSRGANKKGPSACRSRKKCWGSRGTSARRRDRGTARGLREHLLERGLFFERQAAYVIPRPPALDRVKVVHGRSAEAVEDEGELVVVVPPREQGLPAEHLGEDAPDAPDVDRLGVLLERQHDLRCAVPPRGDVLGHEVVRPVALVGAGAAGEAEVADLKVAVGVQQQIAGFQVAVQHVGGMHELQRAERLVDEVLAVVVRQLLRADDAVQVRLHKLLDQ